MPNEVMSAPPAFGGGMPAILSVEEAVAGVLRSGILEGELVPGRRLLQEQLAEQLGVSRIPLRDALHRLEVEGLVRIDQRRGAYVAELTIADIDEIYELRVLLEARCMRYAIRALTEAQAATTIAMSEAMDRPAATPELGRARQHAFYATLYGHSGKARMVELILRLRDDVHRYHVLERVVESRHAHAEIRECIRRGDADGAAELIATHLRRARTGLIEALSREGAHVDGMVQA